MHFVSSLQIRQRFHTCVCRRFVGSIESVQICESIQQVFCNSICRIHCCATILIARHNLNSWKFFLHRAQETILAQRCAGRTFHITHHHNLAFPCKDSSQFFGSQYSTAPIIRRNKRRAAIPFDSAIEHYDRNLCRRRFFQTRHKCLFVKRCDHDSLHFARNRTLDNFDLIIAIIFASRSLPKNVDATFRRPLQRSSMHSLPKFVRRSLWDYGDHRSCLLLRGECAETCNQYQ